MTPKQKHKTIIIDAGFLRNIWLHLYYLLRISNYGQKRNLRATIEQLDEILGSLTIEIKLEGGEPKK